MLAIGLQCSVLQIFDSGFFHAVSTVDYMPLTSSAGHDLCAELTDSPP